MQSLTTQNNEITISAVAIASGGSGYIIGNILTIAGGTGSAAILQVSSVNGSGAITGLNIEFAGKYSVAPSSPNTPTGGSGSTASLTLTTVGQSVSLSIYSGNFQPNVPAQRVTVGVSSSINAGFVRSAQLSTESIAVKRGNASFGILLTDLVAIAVTQNPALSWSPIITTQPANASCVHSSTAATFTVVAGATESSLSYQWQYYTGSAWANCTGTINGCAYTNGTLATLTCTPTTTGQTGKQHRCVVTNATGSTNTNQVVLTIN